MPLQNTIRVHHSAIETSISQRKQTLKEFLKYDKKLNNKINTPLLNENIELHSQKAQRLQDKVNEVKKKYDTARISYDSQNNQSKHDIRNGVSSCNDVLETNTIIHILSQVIE